MDNGIGATGAHFPPFPLLPRREPELLPSRIINRKIGGVGHNGGRFLCVAWKTFNLDVPTYCHPRLARRPYRAARSPAGRSDVQYHRPTTGRFRQDDFRKRSG